MAVAAIERPLDIPTLTTLPTHVEALRDRVRALAAQIEALPHKA